MTTTTSLLLPRLLRLGAAMCFVGHGVFGLQQRGDWVRFYDVVGVGDDVARSSIFCIGVMDVLLGVLVLVRPVPALLAWMALWSLLTCLIRPFSGMSLWEAIERSANVAVPLALVAAARGRWWDRLGDVDDGVMVRVARVGGGLALIGHGWLQAFERKASLAEHWRSVGVDDVAGIAGSFEIALGVLVLLPVARLWPVVVVAAVWKMGTELMFINVGAQAWEWIERGATYAALLAVASSSRRMAP
ncbi:MAG: hypothetical protein Q8O67_12375 [Deltaproteobacteria bacterium]|nr:hypothetical protein [Deltaproteobacteria bacterium]